MVYSIFLDHTREIGLHHRNVGNHTEGELKRLPSSKMDENRDLMILFAAEIG